jgi:phosphomannomutase
VSVATVAGQAFRVFLDANAGAGGPLGTRLLHDLGCDIVQFECDPTGQFAHEPEPIPAHLTEVAPWVHQSESAVGFVLDPDADRLALIDETGTCVSEEVTLALAVKYRLKQASGPVVINMSTSRMVEDIARDADCGCHRSAVGEANVVGRMREVNALIGGEGNGGVIDPRVGYVRDSFVGMALLLDAMAARELPMSRLADELPRYEIVKTKVFLPPDKVATGLAALERHFAGADVDKLDGVRFDWPGKWRLVRASNTEPIVRAIAEAETTQEAARLCAEAAGVLESV